MFASNEVKGKLLSEQLIELASFVKQAAVNGVAAHEVELTLFRGVLKIGRELLSMFIELQGTGDIGAELTLPDGGRLERQPEIYERQYATIFEVNSLSNGLLTVRGRIKKWRCRWMRGFNFQKANSAIYCSLGIK